MIRTTDDHVNFTFLHAQEWFVFCVCFMKVPGRNQLTCPPKTQLHLLVTPFRFWQQHRLPSLLTFCCYTGFPSTQSLVGSRQCHWSQNLTACTFWQNIEWYICIIIYIHIIQSLNFPCHVLLETSVWPPQTWNTPSYQISSSFKRTGSKMKDGQICVHKDSSILFPSDLAKRWSWSTCNSSTPSCREDSSLDRRAIDCFCLSSNDIGPGKLSVHAKWLLRFAGKGPWHVLTSHT